MIDGGAAVTSAGSQYIATATDSSTTGSATLSIWCKAVSFPTTYCPILTWEDPNPTFPYIDIYAKSTGKLAGYAYSTSGGDINFDGTGPTTMSTGIWYYVVMTFESGVGLKGYINATANGTTANIGGLGTSGTITGYLGRSLRNSNNWNGSLDEARIAGVARSADWITTEYNNQSAPGTFMTIGPETGGSVSTQPLSKLVGKNFTPTLTFSGNLRKSFSKSLTAALSFIGNLTKRIPKVFTATLSFVGNLATNLIHGGTVFTKNLVGTLVFSGSLNRQTGKNFAATLTFLGNFRKTFALVFGATLVFTSQLVKRTNKFFSATLSFIGVFVRNLVSTWAYYIDLRPSAFKPTQSSLEATVTESTLTVGEAESTLSIGEQTSELSYTDAESSNFRNVKTNDDS
jgi:hypothetical protein